MIDNYMEKASVFRRIMAYLIDWSIVIFLFISGAIICLIIENVIRLPESVVVSIAALLGCPYLIFKDLIFNGASIGKKILLIKIVKKNTYNPPSKILIVLNTIISVDPITNSFVYYNAKETFSEMITNTVIVKRSKYLEKALEKERNKTGNGGLS